MSKRIEDICKRNVFVVLINKKPICGVNETILNEYELKENNCMYLDEKGRCTKVDYLNIDYIIK